MKKVSFGSHHKVDFSVDYTSFGLSLQMHHTNFSEDPNIRPVIVFSHLCIFYFQVAIKNDVGVFYFATIVPLNMYFDESGQMDKRDFLQMWKEIPEQNEVQFTINNVKGLSAGSLIFLILALF